MTSTINVKPPQIPNPGAKRLIALGAVVVVGIVGVNLLRSSFVSVDANEIGVKIVRGKVEGTLSPGWHLISPIGGTVKKFSTRIQQTSMLATTTRALAAPY